MARYKPYDLNQTKMIPLSYADQIVQGVVRVCSDSRPRFTTIAAFVSSLEHEIASPFGDVLLYASELGLIGKEHFAGDGCKLPSNASKRKTSSAASPEQVQ